MTRVLILGGYGVFGNRLARIQDKDDRLELIIAGRNSEKAAALIKDLAGPSRKIAVTLDTKDIADHLGEIQPDIVVDCVGPFQGKSYDTARACIRAGAHYADISDGRRFAEGFTALDQEAKRANVFAISAASTTSGLSSAAALAMARLFERIDEITTGVTPGNRAPRGLSVVRAILSYVGEPMPQRIDGANLMSTGWGELHRTALADLGPRWFSPCDSPDAVSMPRLFPEARTIKFIAGLELSVLHLSLWSLAKLRRRRLIPNLGPAAPYMRALAQAFYPFGSDRGGMFVELNGEGPRGMRRARLTLVAGSGDGPNIPVLGVAAIVKKLAGGAHPAPGARVCAGDISMAEYEKEFDLFDIKSTTETFDEADALSGAVGRRI